MLFTLSVHASNPLDADAEAALDAYLLLIGQDQHQEQQQLERVRTQLLNSPAYGSQTRYLAMQVLHHMSYDEQETWEPALIKLMEHARAHPSGDVMSEALATKIYALLRQNDLNAAYQIMVELELFLPNAEQPRVRYFAHNLLGTIYLRDNQFELASQNLHAAMEAVIETEGERAGIRRTHLQSQLAQLYADMQNLEQGLELIEQAISGAKIYLPDHLPEYYLSKGYIEGELGLHEASCSATIRMTG